MIVVFVFYDNEFIFMDNVKNQIKKYYFENYTIEV